ncbi:MAG: hypothetical protein ACXADY_16820 [Candidatus Hodarchaeales archaeon]
MYIFIDANIYLGTIFITEDFHHECQLFIENILQSNHEIVITLKIIESVRYRIEERHRWLSREVKNIYHRVRDALGAKKIKKSDLKVIAKLFSEKIRYQLQLGKRSEWRVRELRRLEQHLVQYLKEEFQSSGREIDIKVIINYLDIISRLKTASDLTFDKIMKNLQVIIIKTKSDQSIYNKLRFIDDWEDREFVSQFCTFLEQNPDSSGVIITNDIAHLIFHDDLIKGVCPKLEVERPTYFFP